MGTKLSIVNAMLSAVGEGVQNTIESQHPSVQKAVAFLEDKNEEFQTRGWWFNRTHDLLLKRDTDGKIKLPSNIIQFKPLNAVTGPAKKNQYTQRGEYVYDAIRKDYKLQTDLRADITTALPVEELPATAFHYLKNFCVWQFYVDDDGDLGKANQLEQRAMTFMHQLKVEELQNLQTNVFDRPEVGALRFQTGGYSIDPRWPGGRQYR